MIVCLSMEEEMVWPGEMDIELYGVGGRETEGYGSAAVTGWVGKETAAGFQNSGTSGVGFEGKSVEGWHQWSVRYGQSVHRVSDSICLDAKIGGSLV